MNIGFDLDGVIYPWHKAIYDFLDSQEKIKGLSFSEFWSKENLEKNEEMLNYLASVPLFYASRIPDKKILELLYRLDESGNTIYYITSRKENVALATVAYLNRYKFPQKENLFFTGEKDILVKRLEIDVFVDDREKHLKSLLGICRVIGIEQPYNESCREELTNKGVIFIPDVTKLETVL